MDPVLVKNFPPKLQQKLFRNRRGVPASLLVAVYLLAAGSITVQSPRRKAARSDMRYTVDLLWC